MAREIKQVSIKGNKTEQQVGCGVLRLTYDECNGTYDLTLITYDSKEYKMLSGISSLYTVNNYAHRHGVEFQWRESKIIEIAELIEYLARTDTSAKEKATAIKSSISDGIITADEGLDLIVYYT